MEAGCAMKRISYIIAVVLIVASVSAFYDGHQYLSGRVTKIAGSYLTINGVQYYMVPDCRVFVHEKKGSAFFERKSDKGSIRVGDWVYFRFQDNAVHEVLIENR